MTMSHNIVEVVVVRVLVAHGSFPWQHNCLPDWEQRAGLVAPVSIPRDKWQITYA